MLTKRTAAVADGTHTHNAYRNRAGFRVWGVVAENGVQTRPGKLRRRVT